MCGGAGMRFGPVRVARMADTPTRPGKWIGAEAPPADLFDRIDPLWLVAVAVGCFILAGLISLVRRRKDSACRWVRYPARDTPTMKRWRCTTCGEHAFTKGRSRPKLCKKDLKPGLI